MIKRFVMLLATAGVAGTMAAPASAVTTVLDFTGAICGVAGNEACSNGSRIGQNYGDSAIVNVSYRSANTATNTTFEAFLKYWSGGYGDLTGVVWGGADEVNQYSEITFTPAAGYEVSLLSFQGACYLNRTSCLSFPYATSSGAAGVITPPINGHSDIATNTAYVAGPLVLRWGPDGYDGGLDTITFDVRAVAPTAVPEPASWAMLIGGVGLSGAALRRRRRSALRFA